MLLKISISFFLFLLIFTLNLKAKENWILDRNLSSIEFELPVLLLKNVKGKFTDIEGLVEIDIDSKKNNKAIFSVSIKSIDMNYKKYKDLLLSKILPWSGFSIPAITFIKVLLPAPFSPTTA